jgi:hypothetical protein
MNTFALCGLVVTLGTAACSATAAEFKNLGFDAFYSYREQFDYERGKTIVQVPPEFALPGWDCYYAGRPYPESWITINNRGGLDPDLLTLYDPWNPAHYEWPQGSAFALALGTGTSAEAFEVVQVGEVPSDAHLLRYWNGGNPITPSLDGVTIPVQRNGWWVVADISPWAGKTVELRLVAQYTPWGGERWYPYHGLDSVGFLVPEPGPAVLISVGVAAIAILRRRVACGL